MHSWKGRMETVALWATKTDKTTIEADYRPLQSPPNAASE